ncbi:MAG: UPF0147 family protein [Candidatus Altiarchaeota archaeon]
MTVSDVLSRLDEAIKDQGIPKRVRVIMERVKSEMTSNKEDVDISLTTAIYELDEIVNDVNIPMHAKTVIWNIIGSLEAAKRS